MQNMTVTSVTLSLFVQYKNHTALKLMICQSMQASKADLFVYGKFYFFLSIHTYAFYSTWADPSLRG